MLTEPYRWRLSAGFVAHLWKAATQQHHRVLEPMLRHMLRRDAVVFDVGAHAGQFAKLFAAAAPEGQVYAFEPGSYARSILRCAVWLNRLSNVSIVPLALGAEPGLAVLNLPEKASGSAGFGLAHLGASEARWAKVMQEVVGQTTIDAMVERLGLGRLDFIKADIEGWEVQLLRGASGTLDRLRPRLLIELAAGGLARAGDTIEDASALLAKYRYRGFAMTDELRLAEASIQADGDFWFLPAEDPLIASL